MLSLAASPRGGDGGRLALGTSQGLLLLWRADTAEPLASLAVSPAATLTATPHAATERGGGGRSAAAEESQWVEQLAWSPDGSSIAAAAGHHCAVARRGGAALECSTAEEAAEKGAAQEEEAAGGPWCLEARHEVSGTVYALAVAPGTLDSASRVAVGAYGGVSWVGTSPASAAGSGKGGGEGGGEGGEGGEGCGRLQLGAAAVMSIALSPDGAMLAAGCLDRRVRLFELKAAEASRDWLGFGAAVSSVAWSCDGQWVAAAGGRTLLAVPRQWQPGQAPIVCELGPGDSRGAGARCEGIAWCPAPSSSPSPSSPSSPMWLAALDATGRAYLFSPPTTADFAMPRRAAPLATFAPPHEAPREAPRENPPQPRLAFATADDETPVLLLSRGGCVECMRLPPSKY